MWSIVISAFPRYTPVYPNDVSAVPFAPGDVQIPPFILMYSWPRWRSCTLPMYNCVADEVYPSTIE